MLTGVINIKLKPAQKARYQDLYAIKAVIQKKKPTSVQGFFDSLDVSEVDFFHVVSGELNPMLCCFNKRKVIKRLILNNSFHFLNRRELAGDGHYDPERVLQTQDTSATQI